MKILAGVPTYHRQTAPALAKQLAKFVDKVIIVPQDTELPEAKEYEIIPVERGLRNARNMDFQVARAGGYDAVIHCDDDVKMTDDYLQTFVRAGAHLLERGISSFCGKSRLIAFWDGKGYSNRGWEIRPRVSQLAMLSMKAVNIVGDVDFELFEDIDYALRLIEAGLVPAQFSKPGFTYNHSVTRHGKAEDAGGYAGEEIIAWLPEAITRMNARHQGFAVVESPSPGRYKFTYNWKRFREMIPDLGFGYEDKKGIRC